MAAGIVDVLGLPRVARDPANYAGRAVQLYYRSDEASAQAPAEFRVTTERTASRRGRREAVARDFLTGAAHDFFKKDSRKMAPVATAANAAAGGDAIDGHFNADDDDDDDDDEVDGVFSKTVSRETLLEAERLVLSGHMRESIKLDAFDVMVQEGDIHTVSYVGSYLVPQTPVLLIHGIGGVIPTFYKIYMQLARDRPAYGIDLPGFGLSSRIEFSNDATECEEVMVEMLEQWREKMKINSMVIIGHSFGGYVATCYAKKYTEYVTHLCLIEPWGMYSSEDDQCKSRYWIAEEIFGWLKDVNPVEMARKFGDSIINKACVKMILSEEDRGFYGQECLDYFVRMITTGRATGFKAFSVISEFTFKYPAITLSERLLELCKSSSLPITVLNGEKSDLGKNAEKCLFKLQRQYPDQVKWRPFPETGHHVQVQKPFGIAWYILESVLDTQGLPPLNQESVLLDMVKDGHISIPLPLVPPPAQDMHFNAHLRGSHWNILIAVTIVFPLLAVIVFIVFFMIHFALQTSSIL